LHDSTTHSLRSMRSSLAGNQNMRSEIGRESDKSMTSGKARRCVPNPSAILLSTDDASCRAIVPFVSLATVQQKREALCKRNSPREWPVAEGSLPRVRKRVGLDEMGLVTSVLTLAPLTYEHFLCDSPLAGYLLHTLLSTFTASLVVVPFNW